jgi:AraC-like DNA-binding protein
MKREHCEGVWHEPSEFVRADWLNDIARNLQCLAGDVVWAVDARPLLNDVVRRLPAPSTPVESLLLRGLLWESAYRLGAALHAEAHANVRVRCLLDEERLLLNAFSAGAKDSRYAFIEWAARFYRRLHEVHPPSGARSVAVTIRENFQRPLNVERLAQSVKMTASGLRRAFHAEFGRSPRAYHTVVRLLHALEQVEAEKIDGVALEVGYRSRKNFYRMFKSLTGLTPSAFRRVSEDHRREVVLKAWKDVRSGKRPRRQS